MFFGCAVLLACPTGPAFSRADAPRPPDPAVTAPAAEPWEPDELDRAAPAPVLTVSRSVALGMIHWYRHDLATRSVSRCPFAVSCSHFAERAIRERGFLIGVTLFIDRNLYRENTAMGTLYPIIQCSDGVLRLDDGFFLGDGNP